MLHITHKLILTLIRYNKINPLKKILPNIDINQSWDVCRSTYVTGFTGNVYDQFVLIGPKGRTLLHLAVEANNPEVVKLLLAQGADINAKDEAGQTPLTRNWIFNGEEVLQILLENGAK